MEDLISKTVAVFSLPFVVPGAGETLPAGEYDIETELVSPPDHLHPEVWKASVLVKVCPRTPYPELPRSRIVSLADLDHAGAKDKRTGRALSEFFLEEMLADPMMRLVIESAGVAEMQLRQLYSRPKTPPSDKEGLSVRQNARDRSAIQVAENEGMPPRSDNSSSARTPLDAGAI